MALLLTGSASIADIDDVTVREGKLCNLNFVSARQSHLRMYPWRFASARITLDTPEVTGPDFDYENAFDVPSDMLRLLQVADGEVSYALEQGQILTNEDEIDIYYVKDITDVAEWDALFIEVISHFLAWKICMPLTQDKALKKLIWEGYEAILPKSKHVDSGEGFQRALITKDWVDSRGTGIVPVDRASTGQPR